MSPNAVLEQNQALQTNLDHVFKVTALSYLKEALVKERYEACSELLELARGFGAEPVEIKELIMAVVQALELKRIRNVRRF